MKKNYKKLLKMNNAIDPAAPASGKGVPGKGGATTNYDATMNDSEIRRMIHRKGETR